MTGVGFCAYEVIVNGDVTAHATESSAFEIDFRARGLKPGDPVTVVILHRDSDNCRGVKVLNPEVLQP